MHKKRILFILALVFVLLIGGASVLYRQLSQSVEAEQLAVQESAEEPAEESAQAATEEPAEAPEQEASEEAAEKIKAPDFTVYDAAGSEVHLQDYFGKPIVLNFWASWCGPCQMEMPDFQEKYEELGDAVQFLMINATDGGRETVDTATAFLLEKGYTFPVFFDTTQQAAIAYGAYSMPITFFLDAEGYVAAYASGALDAETLQYGIDMIYETTAES